MPRAWPTLALLLCMTAAMLTLAGGCWLHHETSDSSGDAEDAGLPRYDLRACDDPELWSLEPSDGLEVRSGSAIGCGRAPRADHPIWRFSFSAHYLDSERGRYLKDDSERVCWRVHETDAGSGFERGQVFETEAPDLRRLLYGPERALVMAVRVMTTDGLLLAGKSEAVRIAAPTMIEEPIRECVDVATHPLEVIATRHAVEAGDARIDARGTVLGGDGYESGFGWIEAVDDELLYRAVEAPDPSVVVRETVLGAAATEPRVHDADEALAVSNGEELWIVPHDAPSADMQRLSLPGVPDDVVVTASNTALVRVDTQVLAFDVERGSTVSVDVPPSEALFRRSHVVGHYNAAVLSGDRILAVSETDGSVQAEDVELILDSEVRGVLGAPQYLNTVAGYLWGTRGFAMAGPRTERARAIDLGERYGGEVAEVFMDRIDRGEQVVLRDDAGLATRYEFHSSTYCP